MAKYVTLNDKETQEELYPKTSVEQIEGLADSFYNKEYIDGVVDSVGENFATKDEVKNFVTSEYVSTTVKDNIAELVNSAPDTLDTLGELATALQEKGEVVDALNSAITKKADASEVQAIRDNEITINISTEAVESAPNLGSITINGDSYNVPSGGSSEPSYDTSSNIIKLHNSEWGEFERDIISQPDQEIDGSHLVETVINMIKEGRIPIIDFGTFRIPVSGTYDGTAYESTVGKNVKTFTLVSSHDYPTGSIPNMMYARFEWDSSTDKTRITCVLPSLN